MSETRLKHDKTDMSREFFLWSVKPVPVYCLKLIYAKTGKIVSLLNKLAFEESVAVGQSVPQSEIVP